MNNMLWTSDRKLNHNNIPAILEDQFPNLTARSLKFLGRGWDFEVFEVNDKWVFRFPKRKQVEDRFKREIIVLSEIKNKLPVNIPCYLWVGRSCDFFPYTFGGYAKISGEPIDHTKNAYIQLESAFHSIGIFLCALHSVSLPGEILHTEPTCSIISNSRNSAKQCLPTAATVLPPTITRACSAFLTDDSTMPSAYIGKPCVVHGDLGHSHILLDSNKSKCTGILDWTDMSLSDPVKDFLWMWIVFGDIAIDNILTGYAQPIDSAFRHRLIYLSICKAITEVYYGIQTKDSLKIQLAKTALARYFL